MVDIYEERRAAAARFDAEVRSLERAVNDGRMYAEAVQRRDVMAAHGAPAPELAVQDFVVAIYAPLPSPSGE